MAWFYSALDTDDAYMFLGPSPRKQFVVTCKLCHREVPGGVKEFPFHSIVVTCSLCGEQREYLPSEITLGRPLVQPATDLTMPSNGAPRAAPNVAPKTSPREARGAIVASW